MDVAGFRVLSLVTWFAILFWYCDCCRDRRGGKVSVAVTKKCNMPSQIGMLN